MKNHIHYLNGNKITRTDQLLSIGLLRIEDIAKIINLGTDTIRYRIKLIGIIPFERWWYDEYQLEMIRNYEVYKTQNTTSTVHKNES